MKTQLSSQAMLERLMQALYEDDSSHTFVEENFENSQDQSSDVSLEYFNSSITEKLQREYESLGLVVSKNPENKEQLISTPSGFVDFLYGLQGTTIVSISELKTRIKDESIKYICPYSCIDSNFNKNDRNIYYMKFVCKFHTQRLGNCKSSFLLRIKDNVIITFTFLCHYHNHKINNYSIGSKVPLLTSQQIEKMQNDAEIGMPTSLIRRFHAPDITSNQMYNIIRKHKNMRFENEIQHLYQYTQSLKNKYDIIWKNDSENKFKSLLMINARIRDRPYSRDIVVIDDTECTNRFNYPLLPFLVFHEHNKVQMLAISIIINKEKKSFIDILQSLKLAISSIRIFIVDRLKAQVEAIKHVYPESFWVFCHVHIGRNIESKFGRNTFVASLFWNFVRKKISEEEYVNELKKLLCNTDSRHVQNLLDEIDHYSPYNLKKKRVRGHHTTNAAEGFFGNIKNWSYHELLPLKEILKLCINESDIMMKNHQNIKVEQLDTSVYKGKKLGQYAVEKLEKRIKKCYQLISELSHSDHLISENACKKLENCCCTKGDLPCIHIIYERILTKKQNEVLISEEDISDIYYFDDLNESKPVFNSKITVENKEEVLDFNTIMDKMKFWANAAQRSEIVRNCIVKFFEDCENLKKSLDSDARFVLKTPGAQTRFPRATVEKHIYRKRINHCSICHKPGHNSQTCPKK